MSGHTDIIGDLKNGRFRNFILKTEEMDSIDAILQRIGDKYYYTNNCYTLHVTTPITLSKLKKLTGCQDIEVVPKRWRKETRLTEMAKRIQLAEKNYQQKIKLGKQIDKYITENKISSLVLNDDDSEALKLYNNSIDSWRDMGVKVGFASIKHSGRCLATPIEDTSDDDRKADIAEGLDNYESLTDLSKRNVVISE